MIEKDDQRLFPIRKKYRGREILGIRDSAHKASLLIRIANGSYKLPVKSIVVMQGVRNVSQIERDLDPRAESGDGRQLLCLEPGLVIVSECIWILAGFSLQQLFC